IARPAYWIRHAREAVRFADGMRTLAELGMSAFLEIGPQPVLTGLGRRTLTDPALVWAASLKPGAEHQAIANAAAQLYVHGDSIDWSAFCEWPERRRVPLPTYPFQRSRCWIDGSARKKQPAAAAAGDIASTLYEVEWHDAPRAV